MFANGTLMIKSANEEDSAFYQCQASNGVGAGISKVVKLTVRGKCLILR